MIARLVLRSMIALDRRHSYMPVAGGFALGSAGLAEIEAFRAKVYADQQPYLIPGDAAERRREREIDLSSHHALVRDAASRELIATLRLTRRPDGYCEISRLVTCRRGAGVGSRLLMHAGLWALSQYRIAGVLAICRQSRLPLFRRFGLRVLGRVEVPHRPRQDYVQIAGEFRTMKTATVRSITTSLFHSFLDRRSAAAVDRTS